MLSLYSIAAHSFRQLALCLESDTKARCASVVRSEIQRTRRDFHRSTDQIFAYSSVRRLGFRK